MWRFYAELFLLMAVAFAVGSIVAAIGVRLVVRQKTSATSDVVVPSAAAPATNEKGGSA